MNILLYGPSGSGKSTIGKLLAQKCDMDWFDLDAEIEKESGQTIDTLFRILGEVAFRELETTKLGQILKNFPASIISLGGGALLNEQNRTTAEKDGCVVMLTAKIDTLLARLGNDPYVRPLVKDNPRQRLSELLTRRHDHYASFGKPVETDNHTPEEIVREIQIRCGIFRVSGMGQPYYVLIKPGSLDKVGLILQEHGLHSPVALVCDQNVEPLYADRVLNSLRNADFETAKILIPAGEEHKTIQTVSHLWEGFLQAGVERGSFVIALGGGVTGDLTGFAAATYLRGVPWINIPTTLLSMVDSSLGGKTGADLPNGKNLIGAFHAPLLVLSDPKVLNTLPSREIHSGLAETIKHGIIADPLLYELCRTGWPQEIGDVANLISRAVAVKVDLIEVDPYEKGRRQGLNFGHTIGHGIEKASSYQLSHGESVAIGMVLETRLAESIQLAAPGLANEIAGVLINLGLPVKVPPGLDRESILSAIRLDKKRRRKQIHFALPETIGKVRTGVVIDNWEKLLEL